MGSNTFLVISFVGHITLLGNTFFSQGGVLWKPPTFDMAHAYHWADATTHCASTSFGGLGGWRMPTTTESMGVDRYGMMGTHGWPSVTGNMWTSTAGSYAGGYAVAVFGYKVVAEQNGGNIIFCDLRALGAQTDGADA